MPSLLILRKYKIFELDGIDLIWFEAVAFEINTKNG
jgi:hypothetical protein